MAPAWRLCLLDAAVSGKPRGLTIHIRTATRAVRLAMPTEDAYGTWLLALVAATSWRVDAYYALTAAPTWRGRGCAVTRASPLR